MTFSEQWLLAKTFLQTPLQIGSITPSSTHLAKVMTAAAPWPQISSVAELRAHLEHHFPQLPVYEDALELQQTIRREGLPHVDCVISGLPFFNFTESLRSSLLDGIHKSLAPGGYFIAFQYSLQMKKILESKFELISIRLAPFNVPPAFVYVCRKKESVHLQ
ncbi:phospholipid methyltransferase [Paenibacillus sp. F411]|uniref:Phospholipid N-methyltransferase n=1 Tax=Paenibacillus algicola TaxID=2565926 RepID=A0A4P8XL79_9BACL|nr:MULTISPECIES: phospholipid methyltransferase [Paenibacillus]MBO2945168.1 phospholipid methyltransferase [Paenibacillus sp. F411]QCT02410.1 phospholipid N-methyltransferase [Paenibacillus algicola]